MRFDNTIRDAYLAMQDSIRGLYATGHIKQALELNVWATALHFLMTVNNGLSRAQDFSTPAMRQRLHDLGAEGLLMEIADEATTENADFLRALVNRCKTRVLQAEAGFDPVAARREWDNIYL